MPEISTSVLRSLTAYMPPYLLVISRVLAQQGYRPDFNTSRKTEGFYGEKVSRRNLISLHDVTIGARHSEGWQISR